MRDFRGKINLRQRANKLSLITIFLWSLVTELHTGIFLLQTFFKIYGLKTVAEMPVTSWQLDKWVSWDMALVFHGLSHKVSLDSPSLPSRS